MLAGLSERFGVHPQWFYLWKALQETGGVFIAMLLGLALMGRNGWPIWVQGSRNPKDRNRPSPTACSWMSMPASRGCT